MRNTSLIEQAANIVADRVQSVQTIVVVSAVAGVTDTLIEVADRPQQAVDLINKLEQKHCAFYKQFITPLNDRPQRLHALFDELRETAADQYFRERKPDAWRDQILSYGERASVIIFSAALSVQHILAKPFTAQNFIKTDSAFGHADVKIEPTRTLIRKKLGDTQHVPVVTGFIASDEEGAVTTLGRSGSDYTAGLIADALEADELEIWTDVDGVLTADPEWVPGAKKIDALSFDDIEELSAHGADVIHPKTIRPIRDKTTSVTIKNSYNPEHSGTTVGRDFKSNGSFKTITVNGPRVWLKIKSRDAYKLLNKLKKMAGNNPKIFTFNRSSSFEPARFLIDQNFYNQNRHQIEKWIDTLGLSAETEHDVYKVKKFSNHFNSSEKLTNRIWNLLASNNLQPLHVERTENERYISFLFKRSEAQTAARLFNDHLENDREIINLFIAGTGDVGKTVLQKIRKINPKDVQFRLTGICNSRKMLWDETGIDDRTTIDWSDADATNWKTIISHLKNNPLHRIIFVDATGSEEVARFYPELLKNNIHVVTPSKLANTFEQSFFDELQAEKESNDLTFQYETNVGAGLPVISTVENLQKSGDKIIEISGVVSGTMTYIFNQLKQGVPFSKAVVQARERGYAEPDPRDDLSGEDVARKFLTLARTIGLKVEREELDVESLIPDKLVDVNLSTFLNKVPAFNAYWKKQVEKAARNNRTLQYTGRLEKGEINIGIQEVPLHSPLGQLKGTDNLIKIKTRFYNETPLIIQGPGAGKQVTAGGVVSDILKTANQLA